MLETRFADLAIVYIDDVLNALTVSGFQIPVRAIFDKKANLEALKMLMAKPV